MAERSFARKCEDLRLGDGDIFRGEGILAITKALLQSGVAYVGGYQGAPVSHLMDVLNGARGILDELGIHVEPNGSEAGAAAMLGASINYPLRGAVTFKSTVGTNVASDGLSNLASAGGRAAVVGTSINSPLRGAVKFKSPVGTNVASDALSNLASAGVRGGTLLVL